MLSQFTRPDRSNYTPNLKKSETNDQLDIGWNEGFLSDGRAYRVEAWAQDQVTSVTIFMPTYGIENMSNDQFVQLFEREGLITWQPDAKKSAYAVPITDGRGASLWSVNVVLGVDDRVYADEAFTLRPYGERAVPSSLAPAKSGGRLAPDLTIDPAENADGDEMGPSENDDLSDFSEYPDNLRAWGYAIEEQDTTSAVRWVRYTKVLKNSTSPIELKIAIEFELGISDEPTLSFHQARSYSFNGVRLEVYNRAESLNDVDVDEETETPGLVGHTYLALATLRDVEDLARLLRFELRSF